MFESIDITKRSHPTATNNITYHDKSILLLFILISASYMLPWTAIGSLLHYFAGKYGDKYFVYINCAFYGIGLPLSYTQKKFDIFLDTIYGSKYMFRRRLWIAMTILFIALLFGPICGEYQTIALVTLVGLCTWSSHGAVTTLASLVKCNSSTMQQIGFAFPGIISLILVHTLHMEGDVSQIRLDIFYYTTAFLILPGIIAWFILCRSDLVRTALEGKDDAIRHMILQVATSYPDKYSPSSMNYNIVGNNDDLEDNSLESLITPPNISYLENISSDTNSLEQSPPPATTGTGTTTTTTAGSNLLYNESKQLLLDTPHLLDLAIYSEPIPHRINLHRWTLFITLFISILQGSLLSYTCGCTLLGLDLPPLLYFIRIFSDLLGRPLALLPKPSFFRTIEGVWFGAITRLICSFYFFYVLHTISPHPSLLQNSFQQSFTLCLFQVIFSALSGYFNCLTYEYAASTFLFDWQRLVAAQYLNLTFQNACATGVVVAIGIVMLIEYFHPCQGHGGEYTEPCFGT